MWPKTADIWLGQTSTRCFHSNIKETTPPHFSLPQEEQQESSYILQYSCSDRHWNSLASRLLWRRDAQRNSLYYHRTYIIREVIHPHSLLLILMCILKLSRKHYIPPKLYITSMTGFRFSPLRLSHISCQSTCYAHFNERNSLHCLDL